MSSAPPSSETKLPHTTVPQYLEYLPTVFDCPFNFNRPDFREILGSDIRFRAVSHELSPKQRMRGLEQSPLCGQTDFHEATRAIALPGNMVEEVPPNPMHKCSFNLFGPVETSDHPATMFALLLALRRQPVGCSPQKRDFAWTLAAANSGYMYIGSHLHEANCNAMRLPLMNPGADTVQYVQVIDNQALTSKNLLALKNAVTTLRTSGASRSMSTNIKTGYAIDLISSSLSSEQVQMFRHHVFLNDPRSSSFVSSIFPIHYPTSIESDLRVSIEWFYCLL